MHDFAASDDAASWASVKLAEVASCTLGGTPSTEVSQFWGGGIPWMASGDVHLRRIRDVPGRITAAGLAASNATLVPPPAVAIGLAGQGKTRGTVALTLCELSTNQSIALFRGDETRLHTAYLFHNLDMRYEELRARSSGGGRGGLSKGILDAVPIHLPPIREQHLVTEILDTLDTTIHQTEAIIEKLKQVKQGLLHDLLTRGIDANGELRPPQSQAPHLYKDSPLRWIPASWAAGTLSDWLVGRPKNGYSPQPARAWTGIQMLGLGCLTPEGFQPRQLKAAPVGDPLVRPALLAAGDLLMSRANTRELVGMVGIYQDVGTPCCYPDLIMRLTPTSRTSATFLELVLSAPAVRQVIQAAASGTSGSMVKISGSIVMALPIALPEVDEQDWILDALRASDDGLRLESQYVSQLRALKSGLMDDLLTGRVRVTPLLADAHPL